MFLVNMEIKTISIYRFNFSGPHTDLVCRLFGALTTHAGVTRVEQMESRLDVDGAESRTNGDQAEG